MHKGARHALKIMPNFASFMQKGEFNDIAPVHKTEKNLVPSSLFPWQTVLIKHAASSGSF